MTGVDARTSARRRGSVARACSVLPRNTARGGGSTSSSNNASSWSTHWSSVHCRPVARAPSRSRRRSASSAARRSNAAANALGLVVDEQRVDTVGQHFTEAVARGRDHRGPARERLEHDVRQSLVAAREDERVGAAMRVNVSSCPSAPSKWTRVAHAQLIGERPPRGFLGTIADDVEVHALALRDRGDDPVEVLVRDEPSDEHQPEVTVRRQPASSAVHGADAVRDDPHVVPVRPASRPCREVRARGEQRGRVPGRPVAEQRAYPGGRAGRHGRPGSRRTSGGETPAHASLPRRVPDHLERHRTAREASAGHRDRPEPGGVDDVVAASEPGDPRQRAGGADRPRPRPREPHEGRAQLGSPLVGERQHRDVVTPFRQRAPDVVGVRRRSTDVGRVDPGDDQDPHGEVRHGVRSRSWSRRLHPGPAITADVLSLVDDSNECRPPRDGCTVAAGPPPRSSGMARERAPGRRPGARGRSSLGRLERPRAPRRPSARWNVRPPPGRAARARSATGRPRANAAELRGEGGGVVAREPQRRWQEVVEDRVRGEDGKARRRGLEHDLVGRAGAHVVHQHVRRRELVRRPLGAGSRHRGSPARARPSSSTSRVELDAVRGLRDR